MDSCKGTETARLRGWVIGRDLGWEIWRIYQNTAATALIHLYR